MRRKIALILASVLLLTAGCGRKQQPESVHPKQTIHELTEVLQQDYSLPMPLSLDDELIHDLIGVRPDRISEYSGYISMNPDCPDHLVVVKAAPDCAEKVAGTLEARRAFLMEAYADDPEACERVQAGQVAFLGDYVFLVIAGRPGELPAQEVADAMRAIEQQFEK